MSVAPDDPRLRAWHRQQVLQTPLGNVAVAVELPEQRAEMIAAIGGGASGAAPVAGNAVANGVSPAFVPRVGRPVRVSLRGEFGGARVTVERSSDGGASWSPITAGGQPWAVFSGAADEFVDQAADTTTRFRLSITGAGATTAIAYRLGH